MDGFVGGIVALLALVFVLWLYIFLPASMATSRGRSALGWVVLTLMFSPIITVIALLVLGPTVETVLARERAK